MNNFQHDFLSLNDISHPNERAFEIVKIFNKHFPSEVIQLYDYSIFDHIYRGIYNYQEPKLTSLRHIQESLRFNPLLFESIEKNEVRFFDDNRLHMSLRSSTTVPTVIENIFMVPITVNNVIVAYISAINVDFKVTEEVFRAADAFRHACAQIIDIPKIEKVEGFSEKERIIAGYLSYGYSTKEIAETMNFSEANIKYFIKTVMEKTNSKNRTEAVSKLFRLGVIK